MPAPLVRWGTELHDRFLLPWWVAADIADVVADLGRTGSRSSTTWLAPFLEFRFPRIGDRRWSADVTPRAACRDRAVARARRGARRGGTARYVDSSLERLQVRVDGFTADAPRA